MQNNEKDNPALKQFHAYDVSSEVNIGKLLVDVFDCRFHHFISEEGWPQLGVWTHLEEGMMKKHNDNLHFYLLFCFYMV